jgi:hypothetical protein
MTDTNVSIMKALPTHAPASAPSLSPDSPPPIGVESLLAPNGNVYSNVTAIDVIRLLLMQLCMVFGVDNAVTFAVSTYGVATSAADKRILSVEIPPQQQQQHRTTNEMWTLLHTFYKTKDFDVSEELIKCGRSITEFLNFDLISSPQSPPSSQCLLTCKSHIKELLDIWQVIYIDLQSPLVTHIGCISSKYLLLIGELNKHVTTKIEIIKKSLFTRNYVNES